MTMPPEDPPPPEENGPSANGSRTLEDPFPLWKATGSSWREDALTRIAELETLTALLCDDSPLEERSADELVTSVQAHLRVARDTAESRPGSRKGGAGANVMRVVSNIHAAEAALLRLAPDGYIIGQIPTITAYVSENCAPADSRRKQLNDVAADADGELSEPQRGHVVAAVREANAEARRKMSRIRSFRNVLLMSALFLFVGALGIALMGLIDPTAIPICFTPDNLVVCPTEQNSVGRHQDVDAVIADTVSPWDLALIELLGMVAAAIAAAAALRHIRGTSTPFSLPIALAVLRLPTGALTALLGLLLMRGQFVPGLSDLDTPAQILAWAVVFGYAQELFTRLVDNQAMSVLDDLGSTSPTAQTSGSA